MLLYFLIAPYRKKQVFVQQALHTFVKMIDKVPDEDKLLELIENIEKAPIGYRFNLNTGKMTGIEINNSAIKEIEFTTNTVDIKD